MIRIHPLALAAAFAVLPLPARPADAPPSQPSPAATPSPAPTAAVPSAAAAANMRWEGLVRRNSGLVVMKGRWDVGTLEFREEMLRWIDARDAGKNLLIPASKVTEQFQTCAKTLAGPECFEWGFRTKEVAYTFRDFSWEKGAHEKVAEIYEFMRAIYPSLPSSQANGKR
jgi:hypothetical protein